MGLINFPERVTELTEIFCLVDHQFVVKDITQEQLGRKDTKHKVYRKVAKLPCPLQVHHSPHISRCAPTWKLPESPSPIIVTFGVVLRV